ncbi:hypothetical protein RD792_012464 [Penstemon davidsonii]|uniref:Growth-regulating factor n=1 Tax=Penstemon davidsonii TaxID=160366 RepID=A0ABR0CXB0_9LAMI|nr:hypothetical protein RD792_012464 [Penstemon davidsonii]
MLSFSSPNSQTLPYYQHTSSPFSRNTGINGMYGLVTGVRGGPFTSSQWMELEHQALIYKYITANVPIPSYLLNPIRKAFESAGFSALGPNSLGWGAFHLGFSNTDPEPGRCRRTDGKKWRCSRDAVADQKYCERHMNRGRHRSRKPVEGQPGHPASGTTTTKPMPAVSVMPAGGGSDTRNKLNNLHQNGPYNHSSGIPNINRSLPNKDNTDGGYQNATVLSTTSLKTGLKDKQNAYDQQDSSSRPEFGLVCSDSLLNPLDRSLSLVNCRNYDNKSQHSLRQFMDDWPKNQSEPDRTQLSISIPSDFMMSSTNEKLTQIQLSDQELEATQMGLGVGTISSDQQSQRQSNWVPISWRPPSIGGPLGEVLHNTGECMALNLMESWDSNRSRLASSPTGVLQRGAFASLSNSSAGSSPRAESINGLVGHGLMHPSMPAL